MKRGNLEKWKNIVECNNLLFFSQLVNELLFDYSIPSNRISTLNSHYLCLDALSAIEGIEKHGVPEGTLKPIMEELYSEIKKDPVFSTDDSPLYYFVKYQNDKYIICNRVADMGYRELKNAAVAINNTFFEGNKYYLQLKKRISIIIKENRSEEQQILFRLTKSLLTELMNTGYSLRYLYMTMNRLFWNPKEYIESPEAIDTFFDAFSFRRKEYTVVFKVQKDKIGPLIGYLDGLDCIDELSGDIQKRVGKAFVKRKPSEAFLVISRKGVDPFDAAERATSLIDTNTSVYRLYDHKYNYNIADAECMILDSNNKYIMGRNLKAVEHTKTPSSKEIADSMNVASDAIQNIAKVGAYNDCISVLNAIRYHSHSLDSYSEENQLLDLWAIFESVLDISNKHTSDRIQQICMYLVPLLKRRYLYSLFKQLSDDIKVYNEDIYNEIITDAVTEADVVRRVCEFTLLAGSAEKRKNMLEKCDDFPLLKERVSYYCEVLKSPAQVHVFVEKHAERVRLQIMRIYRNRNLIIHNGSSMPYLPLLIENLHSYVDDFLAYAIHSLAKKKSIDTMCQELFTKECKWNASFPRQKEPITREQVEYILSI
jgi:hypothetical protein